MSILELPPESAPTPVTGVQLKEAFDSFFMAVANKPTEENVWEVNANGAIAEIHRAAHTIIRADTPYAASVSKAAGSFEDYFFERYTAPAEKIDEGLRIFSNAEKDQKFSDRILRGPIQAYAFSGLAVVNGIAMVKAARAFTESRNWVEDIIKVAYQDLRSDVEYSDPLYLHNRRYFKMLKSAAISSLDPQQVWKPNRRQLKARKEDVAMLTQVLPRLVTGPDTGYRANPAE